MRTLKTSDQLEPEKLVVWLADHGYNRLEQVEVPGDFAVRGGIIDIYLPGDFEQAGEQVGLTVRIDFFGDQVESIRRFDLDTLGSLSALESIQIYDLKGQLPDTAGSTHLFSYLDPTDDGRSLGAAGDRGTGARAIWTVCRSRRGSIRWQRCCVT